MENSLNMTEALMQLNKLFSTLVGPGRFKFILDSVVVPVKETEGLDDLYRLVCYTKKKKLYWSSDERKWVDEITQSSLYTHLVAKAEKLSHAFECVIEKAE